jgi:hypothetical protein
MAQNKPTSTPKPEEKLAVIHENKLQALQVEFSQLRSESEKFQDRVLSRLEKMDKSQESTERQFASIGNTLREITLGLSAMTRTRTDVSASTTISGSELRALEQEKKRNNQIGFLLEEEEERVDDGYDTPDDPEGMLNLFKEMTGKSIYTVAAEDLPARKRHGGKLLPTTVRSSNDLKSVAASMPSKSDGSSKLNLATTGGDPDDNGGGGSDDSDDDSSSRNPRDKKKPDRNDRRRRSSHFVDLIAATNNRNLTQVNITRVQAPYDHIVLKQLKISHAVRFFEQFKTYQFVNNVQLAMTHQVSDTVRKQLLAHHPKLTLQGFYALSNEQLIQLIQTHVRPRTTIEFLKVLRDSLEFKYDSKDAPTPTKFSAFYTSLLLYRSEFSNLYDVIAAHNDHIIPPCNEKDGGLIKLFIEKISFDYGKLLYRSLRKTKYSDIHDFIEDFYEIVEKDYRLSEAARSVSEHFGGTDYEVRAGNTSVFKSHSVDKDPKFTNSNRKLFTPNYKKVSNHHNLQAIREASDSDDEIGHTESIISQSDDDNNTSNEKSTSVSQEHEDVNKVHDKKLSQHPAYSYMQPAKSFDSDNSDVDIHEPDSSDERIVNALEAYSTNKDNKTTSISVGCFYRLTGKPCKLGDKCPFSHDYKDLIKAHEYYHNLLAQSKYKSPSSFLRKPGSKA